MANGVWQDTVRDALGRAVAGANVEVLNLATSLPATLTQDRAGALPMDNPFLSDGDGLVRFYTTPGYVSVTISYAGFSVQYTDLLILDEAPS